MVNIGKLRLRELNWLPKVAQSLTTGYGLGPTSLALGPLLPQARAKEGSPDQVRSKKAELTSSP